MRKRSMYRIASAVALSLLATACSSAGHDAIFDGSVGTGGPQVPTSIARQAGQPAELGRNAGEPGSSAPIVHVLGSVRQLDGNTAQWQDDAPIVSTDTASIASLGCALTDPTCSDLLVADWAADRIEIVNVATLAAAEGGAESLADGAATIRASGIEIVGYGANTAEAVAPVLVESGSFTLAVHSISLVVDGDVAASSNGPGIAGAASFEDLLDAVERSSGQGSTTIVFVDWGDKERRSPSAEHIGQVQQIITSGAEFVVGHGADFLQRFEQVGNASVAYNLGNVATTSPDPLRHDSAVLRLEFALGRTCLLPAIAGPGGPALDHPDIVTCG